MTMRPGKYWIGDLCYVMHPQWDDVCKVTIKGDRCKSGEFSLSNGVEFAMYNTKYGDGTYCDVDDNKYGVDSGTLGCIRVDDIKDPEWNDSNDLGHIHEFKNPFHTGRAKNGTVWFGHVIIDTGENDYD